MASVSMNGLMISEEIAADRMHSDRASLLSIKHRGAQELHLGLQLITMPPTHKQPLVV